jgi:hypothetical protein
VDDHTEQLLVGPHGELKGVVSIRDVLASGIRRRRTPE